MLRLGLRLGYREKTGRSVKGTIFSRNRLMQKRPICELHPLDDTRSFVVSLQLPVPYDPQGLVALYSLPVHKYP
jgi:hypothetical protein